MTRLAHQDVLGNNIVKGSRILWNKQFHLGPLTVLDVVAKTVKVEYAPYRHAPNAKKVAYLWPSDVVVIDDIEEAMQGRDHCMCGSRIEDHDIGSGHSPVSMYDYHRSKSA